MVAGAVGALAALRDVRERFLPMAELAAEEYRGRVPEGYPVIVDAVEQGTVGIELDPNYALYLVVDGEGLAADVYRRLPRNDNRSSASRQKQAGLPDSERRPLPANPSDQLLRNLLAELMMHWNLQPGIIHITDS